MTKNKILILDDEPSICSSLSLSLEGEYRVISHTDPLEGIALLDKEAVDLVLLDLVIGEHDGLDILRKIKQIDPNICVIMMTAYGDIRSSVSAMKNGAFTYLPKPLDIEELMLHIRQGLEFRALNERVTFLRDELNSKNYAEPIIGNSPAMQQVLQMVDRLKDTDTSVTITGESGTGKELIAKALHFSGSRAEQRFVAVNCAAIPEGLLEEEFFGHKRGAFTGAVSDKRGKLEMADKGTIFLDEIGDMPLSLQGKLLRALQEKAYAPIGGHDLRTFDARLIVATNRDLKDMVQKGLFRQDLYYRINVFEIELPPLRERRQDIPLLCEHFIRKNNEQQKKHMRIKGITKEAERALMLHDYPGNVRELANALEYASIVTNDEWIHAANLPDRTRRCAAEAEKSEEEYTLRGKTLEELEKAAVFAAYEKHSGKRKAMAEELGISERGLWNKLKKFELI
ncbi:sigma-54 dependent transcriptional regulator [Eubacteriales bacterium OttesenSCG-928-K08]|nr:sigma-54 dependent transcriptional regulator [Eubacteriales bacterium OttesenSCG-928-K08]